MCWELHREIKRVTIIRYLINWSKSLRPYSSSVFALARQQMENPLPLALESGSQSCHIKSSSQTKTIFQEACDVRVAIVIGVAVVARLLITPIFAKRPFRFDRA